MKESKKIITDRVKGAIYGLLVGDALGCPVEGCSPEEIIDQFGRITQMETPKSKAYRSSLTN